jgi:hypothetical protein
MPEENRIVDGYKVIHSVVIGGAEEIVSGNSDAVKNLYRLYQCRRDKPLGEYRIVFESGDYLKAMREFIRRIGVSLDRLGLDRVYRGSSPTDHPLSTGDCVPGGMDTDLTGKVVAVRPEALAPEYRAPPYQLALATGGFGCAPNARGRAVYCAELYSGEQTRWNRQDILGVVDERSLPRWAREKLSALRKTEQRESALAQIREAKSKPSAPRKPKAERKSHGEKRNRGL